MLITSRTRRLSLLTVVAAALAAASLAPTASAAAQRYASPGGNGDCSAANPCSITDAIEGAKAGDEVIVTPGDYQPPGSISDHAKVTIHGVAGQPRPRLHFGGAGRLWVQFGSTLRYVEVIRPSSNTALSTKSAVVDQVIVRAAGDSAVGAASVESSTVRNSIFVASGPNGRAITAIANGAGNNTVLRNVTAIATAGDGVAVEARAQSGPASNATIGAVNVIARGGPSGASFSARTDSSGAQASVAVGHSNYGGGSLAKIGTNTTILSGGYNQASTPVFVNAADGNYRQAAGSPTIGAGLDDPKNGELDVDGDARATGKTDIGADEFAPTPTQPPTSPPPTAPPPATPPQSTPPQSTPPPVGSFAGVRLVSTKLTTAGRFITLKLSCPAATVGRCTGHTKLTTRRRRSGTRAAATVGLGRARFSIAAGKQARVRLRASRARRRLLGRTPRLRGRATSAARDAAGRSVTTVAKVSIRRRQR
jgi:hypothetical protein